MPNKSPLKSDTPSSKPRKSNLDYTVDNTPEARARYMELVKDYPNVVARRHAMMQGKIPPVDQDKKDR